MPRSHHWPKVEEGCLHACAIQDSQVPRLAARKRAKRKYTPATVDLSIDGGSRTSFSNSDVTNGFVNWKQFTYEFTAASNSTTIDFFNGTPIGVSVMAGLDNVSLAAVPEPTSMALVGMIAVPFGWKRLRQKLRGRVAA